MLVVVIFVMRLTKISFDIDETIMKIRRASYKNWQKTTDKLIRATGGKIGKPNTAT